MEEKFTGVVEGITYKDLYDASGFDGTLEEYMKHHHLCGFSVSFYNEVQFSDGRISVGAFLSTEQCEMHKINVSDKISGTAIIIGGGVHVHEINEASND